MKRFMVVILAAGIVAAAGSTAFAQEGPRGPQRRGMGAGGPMGEFLKDLPEEKRAEIMKKLREATPEQRRELMERLRAAAAPKDGEVRRPAPPATPPEAGAKRDAAPKREGKAGAAPIRQWLQTLPAERREQIVTRLRNASPEDRQAFLRRVGERMRGAGNARPGRGGGGMQGHRGMQGRRGMEMQRGGGRGGMQAQRGGRRGMQMQGRRGMRGRPGMEMQRGPGRHGMQAQRGGGRGGMQSHRGMGRGCGGMQGARGPGRGRMQGAGQELRRPPLAPRGGVGRGFPIL